MTVIEKCEMCGAKVIDGELAPSDREQRLEEALMRIAAWGDAYPFKSFPEPDWDKVKELLAAGGIGLDRVSAANMRHVAQDAAKIAREALKRE